MRRDSTELKSVGLRVGAMPAGWGLVLCRTGRAMVRAFGLPGLSATFENQAILAAWRHVRRHGCASSLPPVTATASTSTSWSG